MKRIVVLLFFGSLCAMNSNRDPRVAIDSVHRAGYPEFFISFKNPSMKFVDMLQLPTDALRSGIAGTPIDADALGLVPMIDLVPYIGHYQNPSTKAEGRTVGDSYNFRARLALIQFRDGTFGGILPEQVRRVLADAGFVDLSHVEFSAQILGTFVRPDETPFTPATRDTCNIAYHPVVRRWRGTGLADFNVPVLCGIFAPNGVRAITGGISVDRLAELPVNYHGKVWLSPDVGRVLLEPTRGIITFWTVAVYEGHAHVVFNVVANNAVTERLLLPIAGQRNFDGVLAHIARVAEQLSDADMGALVEAHEILHDAQVASSRVVVAPRPAVASSSTRETRRPVGSATPSVAIDSLEQLVARYIENYGSIQNAIIAAIDDGNEALVNALLSRDRR